MKRRVLCLAMVAGLMVGCGNQSKPVEPPATVSSTEAAVEETTVEEEVPTEAEVVPQTIESPTLSEKAKAAIDESIKAEMETAVTEETEVAETEANPLTRAEAEKLYMPEDTSNELAMYEGKNKLWDWCRANRNRVILEGVELVVDENIIGVLDGLSSIEYREEVNGYRVYNMKDHANMEVVAKPSYFYVGMKEDNYWDEAVNCEDTVAMMYGLHLGEELSYDKALALSPDKVGFSDNYFASGGPEVPLTFADVRIETYKGRVRGFGVMEPRN